MKVSIKRNTEKKQKPVFKPFSISIDFDNEAEVFYLLQSLNYPRAKVVSDFKKSWEEDTPECKNIATKMLSGTDNTFDLFYVVHEEMIKQGFTK